MTPPGKVTTSFCVGGLAGAWLVAVSFQLPATFQSWVPAASVHTRFRPAGTVRSSKRSSPSLPRVGMGFPFTLGSGYCYYPPRIVAFLGQRINRLPAIFHGPDARS